MRKYLPLVALAVALLIAPIGCMSSEESHESPDWTPAPTWAKPTWVWTSDQTDGNTHQTAKPEDPPPINPMPLEFPLSVEIHSQERKGKVWVSVGNPDGIERGWIEIACMFYDKQSGELLNSSSRSIGGGDPLHWEHHAILETWIADSVESTDVQCSAVLKPMTQADIAAHAEMEENLKATEILRDKLSLELDQLWQLAALHDINDFVIETAYEPQCLDPALDALRELRDAATDARSAWYKLDQLQLGDSSDEDYRVLRSAQDWESPREVQDVRDAVATHHQAVLYAVAQVHLALEEYCAPNVWYSP